MKKRNILPLMLLATALVGCSNEQSDALADGEVYGDIVIYEETSGNALSEDLLIMPDWLVSEEISPNDGTESEDSNLVGSEDCPLNLSCNDESCQNIHVNNTIIADVEYGTFSYDMPGNTSLSDTIDITALKNIDTAMLEGLTYSELYSWYEKNIAIEKEETPKTADYYTYMEYKMSDSSLHEYIGKSMADGIDIHSGFTVPAYVGYYFLQD